MPLGRKHLRRSRDAPTGGIGRIQRTTSRLGCPIPEVNPLDAAQPSGGPTPTGRPISRVLFLAFFARRGAFSRYLNLRLEFSTPTKPRLKSEPIPTHVIGWLTDIVGKRRIVSGNTCWRTDRSALP